MTALGAVACGGVLLLGPYGFSRFGEHDLLVFAALALLGELVPLKVYTRGAEGETTTSTTFCLALLISGGPEAALVGIVGANLVADLARRKPPHKVAFNMAQYAIAVAAAGAVLAALSDVPHAGQFHFAPDDLPAILAAALTFFAVNTSLVAAVIAMVEGVGIWRYLVDEWLAHAATTGLMLGLAPIIVLSADYALPLICLLFLPLYAIHRGGSAAIAREHEAIHDALTGLPNRVLFRERVDEALHAARRDGLGCTVMLMDLNHFKEINDTLGHHQGDRLLQEVAARLRAADTVARLGGDTLVQRADIAMYASKAGSSGYAVFDPIQDHHGLRRLTLAAELRRAIERGELSLAFQPKAELNTGRIVGVEALARWEHAEFGAVGPVEFRADRRADRLDRPADHRRARPGARARRRVAGARA